MPETEVALLYNYLTVGAIVFAIGLVGFLTRRNVIVMFLCVEMMLQGVALTLVAFSRYHNDWGGQMFVIFIITVAACEAAVALALVLMIVRRAGTLDIAFWQLTREENQPMYVDLEVPEPTEKDPIWPHLTPAGVEPPLDQDALAHRNRV
jgi:NADH-quinone oxidoreductase subunit K